MDTWLRWGLLSSVLAGSGIWLLYETLTKPRAPRRARNVITGSELQVRYEAARFLMVQEIIKTKVCVWFASVEKPGQTR